MGNELLWPILQSDQISPSGAADQHDKLVFRGVLGDSWAESSRGASKGRTLISRRDEGGGRLWGVGGGQAAVWGTRARSIKFMIPVCSHQGDTLYPRQMDKHPPARLRWVL